jgi:hypothetical protein
MKLTPSALLKNALSIFLAAMAVACQEAKDSDHQEEATMRNEIVAYAKSLKTAQQIDVTHLVEKHIKVGDSLETARAVLLENGFSFAEREDRKDVKVTYRIHATYKIEENWWSKRTIAIFLCDSPESEKVDSVLAKVNFKTL